MAAGYAERVLSLAVVEAVIGGLAGGLFDAGGPWWFGFHQAPGGLADEVVAGHEERYVRFFLDSGSAHGVPADLAARFVSAYTGRERLAAAFRHYRAMPANARWNRAWAEQGRLRMPVAAVGGSVVGAAPARQLVAVAEQVAAHVLADSGHIVPLDQPAGLAAAVLALAGAAGGPSGV